jgi:hypothetical protein
VLRHRAHESANGRLAPALLREGIKDLGARSRNHLILQGREAGKEVNRCSMGCCARGGNHGREGLEKPWSE